MGDRRQERGQPGKALCEQGQLEGERGKQLKNSQRGITTGINYLDLQMESDKQWFGDLKNSSIASQSAHF